ncbi:MAG: tRNA (adenosine(37)-N6)-threonylcarbamoyltransferase complex ATPase subunit type 1 TsaE [Planctomycetes bacterium]|nr:tRNA (adenosine(37)-N6)-threonylcarbamoyltransferase complex ATPase subunit type 1 TsaE [Planctomycetota bacterium]
MEFSQTITCPTEQDLIDVSREFSTHLKQGDVCLMHGDVGAGKTFFTTAAVAALGGDARIVGSPSFTLVNIYPFPQGEIYHVDLYRLDGLVEEDDVSQEDWMCPEQGMSFIEWAERLEGWKPEQGYALYFNHLNQGRSVRIEPLR